MKKVIVVGAGLSGLSASVFLSKNYKVTLIEASPKGGGRASSFYSKELNKALDNGQHILMGCYEYTIKYLKEIGTYNHLDIPDSLNITFKTRNATRYKLKSLSFLYPFNILLGLLSFNYLGTKDKFVLIRFFVKLFFTNPEKLTNKTIQEWLNENGQTEKTIKGLWEVLVVGALNTSLEQASAKTFAKILKQIFFTGNFSTKILVPVTDLLSLFVKEAENYIHCNDGEISNSERVTELVTNNNKITKIITNRNSYTDFDYIVMAVPHHAISKIECNTPIINEINFEYSPILSVHIFLSQNPFTEKYYGLIDSPVQWIFNHQSHISLVTSNPEELIKKSAEEIMEYFTKEIESYFPEFHPNIITGYKIVKEKRATFIPDNHTEFSRAKLNSVPENLILSGDWTNTGLPATIESAIKSGIESARTINAEFKN